MSMTAGGLLVRAIGAALALVEMVGAQAAAPSTATQLAQAPAVSGPRQMEKLGRGVVAINQGDGKVFVSWRLLGTDPDNIAFNLYRTAGGGAPVKLNATLLTKVTWYQDSSVDFSRPTAYFVRPVLDGQEQAPSAPFRFAANAPARPYLSIPLQPGKGVPNDASVGDLDGDGEYELVLKREDGARDNAHAGTTGSTMLEAYKLDGAFLWKIDLGRNIRGGAHYTQFMVYDLDGDGKAEIVCKTADGTVDAAGKVVGDASANYVSQNGYILEGPEFLTVFEGATGKALYTTNYYPPRGSVAAWGDNYGNRVDRFLACVAYLDGVHPSVIMCRGYYTRAVLAAYNWNGKQLNKMWVFDSDDGTPGNRAYRGQGNHGICAADVDGDGKDEIIYGAAVIDHDGKGLYSTGLGHGDAMHLSVLDPTLPGLQVWDVHEKPSPVAGAEFREAATGRLLWGKPTTADNGRGMTADIDPRYPGSECWSAGVQGLFSAKGELIANRKPRSCNFAVWWDGRLLRNLLDQNRITKWNWETSTEETIVTAEGCVSNNGTKATPCLSADILGDWREEVIWRTADNSELRIYTTTYPTDYRIYTLMRDPVYRLGIAWQNVAYNQPPHTGFWLGEGMKSAPRPHIEKIKALDDDSRLDLGSPAVDPKWRTASARGYSPKVVLASERRGAFAADPPANQWTPLGDGAFKLPEKGYPSLSGSRMLWIGDCDCGLIAPLLTEYPKDYGVWTISHKEPAWKFTPSSLPDGYRPDLWDSQHGYVYLPGLKKVLVVRQLWHYSPKKAPVTGWLVDPQTAAWQPIEADLSMADSSKDFNPSFGRDGLRMPLWCSAVYDATNQEAVIFGGGGTWGRVGKEREKVGPGDWIYDEPARRIRRLTSDDKPLEARRWFPAHCGTWAFSAADKTWRSIAQPLGRQPSGRILPSMAYDAGQQKIVLFGGDDLTRCLADTWVYDCKTRTWAKTSPKTSPTPRASAALVYVPDQKVMLLAGGYAGGWRPLSDVWAYSTKNNEWMRLAIDLPAPAGHASGDFDPKTGRATIVVYPATRGNKRIPVLTVKLDLAFVGKAEPQPEDPKLAWHCKVNSSMGSLLPDEWLADKFASGDPVEGRNAINALPLNTWVLRKPPYSPPARNWGSCIYDIRTHRGYVWGGGHSTYPGADVIEYDLFTDRWRGMADPPNYNPIWLHGMSGGPPGVSLQGGSLLPTHSRKSYGIDSASDSLVTYVGDVYSLKHRAFVANAGTCPGRYDVATQVSFCPTPHGLYGYSSGLLAKVNVAEGKWEEVAKGGPGHEEHNHLCYDSKRDRLIYFVARKNPRISVFDFRDKTWTEETIEGRSPAVALGDSTYVPELDAAMLVFATDPKAAESMYFYKLAEHKWYTAPCVGDKPAGINTSGRDFSPIYDPELTTVVRLQCVRGTQVLLMRLDPATLKLTPLE